MQEVRDKRVTVAGLGRFGGGIEVTRWLVAQGARVLVTDKDTPENLAESLKKLEGLPIELRLGEHRVEDFTNCDLVVASPAIPPTNEYLAAARRAGVPVTTEIRLFIERCPGTIIGVTGTKGKSTTAKLTELMLSRRYKTWLGGNFGGSLLPRLPEMCKTDLVVLELSSYMLEHLRPMQWSPHVAIVTMITQDHVSWHGSFEAYLDAKKNIVRFQRPDDVAVLSEENELSASFARETKARIVQYGLRGRKLFTLTIPGRHNQLNAQAAYAAADVFGVSWDEAQLAVRDFPGLPHRLQLVHQTPDGVRFVNDSIATIPEAAVAALESFPPKRVIQIVGGYDKGLPLGAMCAALTRHAKAVLCIGATGPAIAQTMAQADIPNAAAVYQCGDLPTAMKLARQIAAPGDVVLLSPGCASYDQFPNFEARGQAFTSLARQLDTAPNIR
ncbi:UDP-N-acetylmuramoyl-L-alanine--D-glutamate ligase [Fontivita pretiosa]|uniref:UDP-N-acetylmuramoyl-L-alanine--D-glutamate ligase n=1 Tax=Fontivita pretiosa TaxID=2989684 RepID=UPI003D17DEBF